MNTQLPGKFLQKKLTELNSALFFAEGDALIKLPNSLVTGMEVKASGEIVFVLPKPAHDVAAFDAEFPVRMEFFRKGKPFRLKVQGMASIITDEQEVEERFAASRQLQAKRGIAPVVLVKVTIKNVDYIGEMTESFSERIKQVGVELTEWLFTGSNVEYAE